MNKDNQAKYRLAAAHSEHDSLVGRFNAIESLRSGTHWFSRDGGVLIVAGDPHVLDEEWNKGLTGHGSSSESGHFCAYCALRSEAVLARHRFTECIYRRLAGQAEYSIAAIENVESELSAKEQVSI